jgi:hypothetical protein
MSDARRSAVTRIRERQSAYAVNPWSFRPLLLGPAHIRLLVVTDGPGSFGEADLGLRALLDVLDQAPGPWARIEVTTAHRRADSTADLQDFRFDRHDLAEYHEIWLFGAEARDGVGLSDPELSTLAGFMDAGGGVFATGGAGDLGAALCGRVPRVRSMRSWTAATDPGSERACPDPTRPEWTLARLVLRRYPDSGGGSHPHPVLSGPRGEIRRLPGGAAGAECLGPNSAPDVPGGVRPEVVAWHPVDDVPAGTEHAPRPLGRLSCLDGDAAGVGRVVVAAGWHPFVNVTMVGENGHPDPDRAVGLAGTATGYAALEDVAAHQRALAVWLAPGDVRRQMWWRALWWVRWHHGLAAELATLEAGQAGHAVEAGQADVDLDRLARIGRCAAELLAEIAGRAMVHEWVSGRLRRELPDGELGPPIEDLPAVVLDAVLGAEVQGLAAAFPVGDGQARARAEDVDLDALVADGVRRAISLAGAGLRARADRLVALAQALTTEPDRPLG